MVENHHDPLERQREGEPRFVLLARDWAAPDLVRLWTAFRKRDESLVDAIVKRLKDKMRHREWQAKDAKHVISANGVANDMDLWLLEESRKPIEIEGEAT